MVNVKEPFSGYQPFAGDIPASGYAPVLVLILFL